MPVREIRSSAIRGIEHDGETLRVHFKNGGVYDYPEISAETVEELVNAESPGRYLQENIIATTTGVRAREDEIDVTEDDLNRPL